MSLPRKISSLMLLSALATSLHAQDSLSQLKDNLESLNPNLSITGSVATPVDGILEIELGGREIIYASESGSFIFTGQLVDITDGRNINLTEQSLQRIRHDILVTLDPSTFITYPATEKEAHQIYVFTDTSCGYCQNFHNQISAINDAGVTVHYLAFPREGMSTATARLMERAWCAEEPRTALTRLKTSGNVSAPPAPCEAPIGSHYQIGASLGVNGTPYILTPDGRNLGGFLSTSDLLAALR